MASRRRSTKPAKARSTTPKNTDRSKLPIKYAGGKPHDFRGEKVVNGFRVRT